MMSLDKSRLLPRRHTAEFTYRRRRASLYTLRLYNNKPGANYEYSPLRIRASTLTFFFFFPAPPTREKPTGRGSVLNIFRTAFYQQKLFWFAAIIIL
jgi:hypothetical protein